MEVMDMVNSDMTLLKLLTLLLRRLTTMLTVLLFWIWFQLLMLVFSEVAFPPPEVSDHVFFLVFINFSIRSKGKEYSFTWSSFVLILHLLGWLSWSYQRCLMGGCIWFGCLHWCYWILRVFYYFKIDVYAPDLKYQAKM